VSEQQRLTKLPLTYFGMLVHYL